MRIYQSNRFTMLSAILAVTLFASSSFAQDQPKDFSDQSIPTPPPWAQTGVVYELFVRTFTPEGTFQAAIPKLDYLKDLGIDIVWLMPIYPIGEKGRKGTLGSPYSILDFRSINPEFGTADDLHALVREVHKRDMKIILDFVANHSSNDHILMGEHPDWFLRDASGNFTREVADWSDITDFNYDNQDLRRYVKDSMLYWLREFDIDGYRCDVAGMVPYDFWLDTLKELHREKPDIFMLAEWEDPEILLSGFDSDYTWTFYHLLEAVHKGEKTTADVMQHLKEKFARYPQNALPMWFIENHDEERSRRAFGSAVQCYANLIFTLPGIPLIHSGQEYGEFRKFSLFDKEELKWNVPIQTAEEVHHVMYKRFYSRLIQKRKQHSCFTRGTFEVLDVVGDIGNVGAFLRRNGDSAALVICNLSGQDATGTIRLNDEQVETMKDDMVPVLFSREKLQSLHIEHRITVDVPKYTVRVYVNKP